MVNRLSSLPVRPRRQRVNPVLTDEGAGPEKHYCIGSHAANATDAAHNDTTSILPSAEGSNYRRENRMFTGATGWRLNFVCRASGH